MDIESQAAVGFACCHHRAALAGVQGGQQRVGSENGRPDGDVQIRVNTRFSRPRANNATAKNGALPPGRAGPGLTVLNQ